MSLLRVCRIDRKAMIAFMKTSHTSSKINKGFLHLK